MKITLSRICFLGLTMFGAMYSNTASAQFEMDQLSFGAGLGYTGHAQDIGGSLSFNLRGNYEMDELNSIAIGFNTQLPCTKDYAFTAHAFSSTTTPSSVDANVEQKIAFYNISADFHRYFVKDIEESFGIYGLAGVGLTFAKRTLTESGFDKSQYSLGTNEFNSTESFNGFMINLGAGTNINLNDMMAIFGEAKIGIPAGNEYNSRGNSTITNPIPFNYSLQVGLRYNLFD